MERVLALLQLQVHVVHPLAQLVEPGVPLMLEASHTAKSKLKQAKAS